MEVWKTEGPRVNFEKRLVHYEIYTWTLCHSYLHEKKKKTSRIQSLNKCWTCTEFSEAFTFLMENIYVQFDGLIYQQIVGIHMGTNCAPLIADLFLYCTRGILYQTSRNPNGLTS